MASKWSKEPLGTLTVLLLYPMAMNLNPVHNKLEEASNLILNFKRTKQNKTKIPESEGDHRRYKLN